jgi:Zn-finger nucleic acid-binding protein
MTQNIKQYKCPYCACLFLTQADLDKHISVFGKIKEQHETLYNKTHGRLEHGYSEE